MSGATNDPAPAAKANRFASLLSGAANAKASPAAPVEPEEAPAPVATAAAPPPPPAEAAATALPSPTATAARGPGRPRGGKRSDPSYTQVTAYVRAATYRDVKLALLRADEPREFSDLVEELLADWLRRER